LCNSFNKVVIVGVGMAWVEFWCLEVSRSA